MTTHKTMSTKTKPEWFLKPVIAAYIECALWASSDDSGNSLDEIEAELSPDARKQLEDDCANFIAYCDETLGDDWHEGLTLAQIGHDFWLTRNRHGAGFWDRGLGDMGRKLTDAAHTFGSCDLYVGDDGMIYAS